MICTNGLQVHPCEEVFINNDILLCNTSTPSWGGGGEDGGSLLNEI